MYADNEIKETLTAKSHKLSRLVHEFNPCIRQRPTCGVFYGAEPIISLLDNLNLVKL